MSKPFFLTVFLIFAMLFSYHGQAVKQVDTERVPQIFFVDRRLHRLISLDFPQSGSEERICKKMITSLINGREENQEILRILPNIPGAISVKVHGNTAYVNLSGSLAPEIQKNSENERLVIYQIVNSITSIDGIDSVMFTIDGEVQKSFLGFLDMREIFTANYDL